MVFSILSFLVSKVIERIKLFREIKTSGRTDRK